MRREILAGLSTFFTVSYFFLLYPKILSAGGLDLGASLTATILTLVLSTFFFAFYAQFPAILAPSLGIGAYLSYSVISTDQATWQTALGVVFWAGLLMFLLSLFKVRQKIFLHLPHSLISAAIAGMGLFLICVGLKDLGILIPGSLQIGPIATLPNGIVLFGLLLFWLLHYFRIASAFLLSILACWGLALCFGLTHWRGIAALPPSLSPSFLQIDFLGPFHPSLWTVFISVFLINLIDSTASLSSLARIAHAIDDKGHIKNLNRLLIPDGCGSILSALLGTTTLAFFLESSSGIKAGGRTGMTAFVAALCTLICLFFYPIISSIPLFASTPALIAIGGFMALEIKEIDWRDWTNFLPALLTFLTIPATFNVYEGFAIGFISFAALKAITGQWKKIHPICWGLAIIFFLHFVSTILFT